MRSLSAQCFRYRDSEVFEALSKAIAFFVAMWANQAQGKFLAYVYGCCKDLGMQHSQAITLTPSLLVEASNNHK